MERKRALEAGGPWSGLVGLVPSQSCGGDFQTFSLVDSCLPSVSFHVSVYVSLLTFPFFVKAAATIGQHPLQ